MLKLFPIALMLCAITASAQTRSARLLTDAPTVLLGATPRLLDAALAATDAGPSTALRTNSTDSGPFTPSEVEGPSTSLRPNGPAACSFEVMCGEAAPLLGMNGAVPAVAGIGFGEHFGKTAAIGMASSVTGVLIGAGLGMLSNNLIAAAIPVLLANLFLPPVVTVLMAMLIGNWDSPGRFSFWGPAAGAFVVNAAAYVIASLFLVVPWTSPIALLVYSLVDGVLMSGVSVGIMHLTEKKKAPATITSFVPGVSDTAFVALTRVNL